MRMFAIGLGAVPERVTNAHEGMEGRKEGFNAKTRSARVGSRKGR
jgi:hypothetical protein